MAKYEISDLKRDVLFPVPEELRRGAQKTDERYSVDQGHKLLNLMDDLYPIEGCKILDFGCGIKLVQALMERGVPQKKYVGFDIYKEMIDFANRFPELRDRHTL